MTRRREIDGKYYRLCRGKWVEIPAQRVGKTLHPQSKRKRLSKGTNKVRRRWGTAFPAKGHPWRGRAGRKRQDMCAKTLGEQNECSIRV
jgi:hypothetical protein